MRRRVQRQRSDRQLFLRRFGCASAQHGLDASLEFPRTEGLGDVVVDPRFEAGDSIAFIAARGHHDDRQFTRARIAAQAACEGETGLPGKHPVEQNQIRQCFPDLFVSALGILRSAYRKAGVLEIDPQQLLDSGLILDHQNGCAHRSVTRLIAPVARESPQPSRDARPCP